MAKIDVNKNLFTRAFGGTKEPVVADPFISGYAFIKFENLPAQIRATEPNAVNLLTATAIGVTLPTIDLNKTTIRGLGGTKWSVPTDLVIGDTVSVRYVELAGLPISKIHTDWVYLIRDIRFGASNIQGASKTKYAANLLYVTTKPDGVTIENAYYMTGIFPQRIPSDSHNFDVNTVDRVEIEITYNVDNIYLYQEGLKISGNEFVLAKARQLIQKVSTYKQTIKAWTP